jgi:hypothetical protein
MTRQKFGVTDDPGVGAQIKHQPLHLLAENAAFLGQSRGEHLHGLGRQPNALADQALSDQSGQVPGLVFVDG